MHIAMYKSLVVVSSKALKSCSAIHIVGCNSNAKSTLHRRLASRDSANFLVNLSSLISKHFWLFPDFQSDRSIFVGSEHSEYRGFWRGFVGVQSVSFVKGR